MGSGTAIGNDDPVEMHTERIGLAQDLGRAGGVTQTASGAGAAQRHHEGFLTFMPEFFDPFGGITIRNDAKGKPMDLRAEKGVQHNVAVVTKVIVGAHGGRGQNQFAGQALASRDSRGQPCVIGLETAPGHECVGTLRQGFAE